MNNPKMKKVEILIPRATYERYCENGLFEDKTAETLLVETLIKGDPRILAETPAHDWTVDIKLKTEGRKGKTSRTRQNRAMQLKEMGINTQRKRL